MVDEDLVTDFELLEGKIVVLKTFATNLRKSSVEKCHVLADAVDRVLKESDADEIEKAFEWCDKQYGD
jgi:hypothetical protein